MSSERNTNVKKPILTKVRAKTVFEKFEKRVLQERRRKTHDRLL